jgi:hypothetical protein
MKVPKAKSQKPDMPSPRQRRLLDRHGIIAAARAAMMSRRRLVRFRRAPAAARCAPVPALKPARLADRPPNARMSISPPLASRVDG